MIYADLRTALEPVDGRTIVSASSLTPNVATLLNGVTSGQPIQITSAVPGPGDGINDTVVVTGVASVLNVLNVPVELTATIDTAGNSQLTMTFTLIGASAGPTSWQFSSSFPSLPQQADWNGTYVDATSVALDQLPLTNSRFVLTTQAATDATSGVTLAAGANFIGQLQPTGIVAFAESMFGQTQPITLFGTITSPAPTSLTQPLAPGQWPWQLPNPPPGINLQAAVALGKDIGSLKLASVGLRFYSPPTSDWLTNNPTYSPVQAYTASLTVPSADITADVVAPIALGGDTLTLLGSFTGISIAKLAAMVDALGTNALINQMPPQIASVGDALGQLQLTALALELSLDPVAGLGITWAAATIGMPELNWKAWPGTFEVDSIFTRFEVTSPFSSPSFDVTVYGTVEVLNTPVDILATNDDGFVVYARLQSAETIPLSSFISQYASGITPPGDLTIDSFQIAIAPNQYYAAALAMASQPNPWTIPLGPNGITISDVGMSVSVPSTGSTSGSIAGTVGFTDIGALSILYSVPGPLILRGTFDEVKLSGLLSELTNQQVSLPTGFDLDFTSSTALVQAQGGNYLLQLGTQVAELGSLAFQAQKIGGQWGFAVGLDLVTQASSTPGLSAISAFENIFNLDTLVLVVSSFDQPGFTFPDLAAFNNPTIQAKSISLPSQAPGVAQGLNLYAQWTLDNTNQQQLLRQLLGLHPTLGITLQIGEDPAANSKLFVSLNTMINGLPLTCQFGGLIANGEVGLFLIGSMQAMIQGQTQTFDVVLLFVENGAFISGTMKGGTTVDFGSFRLGNLALEIGVDWEGIPSLGIAATIDTSRFEASVAVFFDSAFPSKSLVAGSVSNLSLADVLETFAPGLAPSVVDQVLSQISLTGTGSFVVPANVGPALDGLDMATVSAAFAAQHVTIPASISQVLLVNPDSNAGSGTPPQPGTRWYLTDMTADSGSGLRHYELAKQSDGTVLVSLSPQFYCAPQATMIGSIPYPQGFFITAGLDIFGWTASVTVVMNSGSGIAVDAAMDPIVISSPDLLALTGAQGVGGPALSVATFTQPAQPKPEFQPPHFFATGELTFLGLDLAEFYIDVTSQGFVFDIVGTLLPLVTYNLHGHFLSEHDFGAGGSVTVGFSNETIDLGLSSGPISLNTNAEATVDISYDGNVIDATCSFSFTFQGQTLQVAEFDLPIETGPLGNIWQVIKDKIIYRLLHADISLHVDNTVQQHLDQAGTAGQNTPGTHTDNPGSAHIDQSTGSHIDSTQHDWQGHPTSHNDQAPNHTDTQGTPHLDQSTPHLDTPGTPHLDNATQHQDQGYHVDQGVEVTS